jgi:heme-degrading monooxygenase HmoA
MAVMSFSGKTKTECTVPLDAGRQYRRSMWIRLGSFSVIDGKVDDLRSVYNRECVAMVKAATGNVDCYLMESAADPRRCIVCTIWRTEQDAKAYEASGTAMEVVGKLRSFFAGPPTLESFFVATDQVPPASYRR